MDPFRYERPTTRAAALAALAAPGSVAIGGGTDLLVTVEEGLVRPDLVVDVRALPDAQQILIREDGSVHLGAAVRIADLAAHQVLRKQCPVLAEAAASVGTPALRNMGTLAGNLAQRPRCWYLRRGVSCFKNGGDGCPAARGENRYHGIVADGPCRAVHPSDPAVALEALGALVEIADTNGVVREVSIADLYKGASSNRGGETTLSKGELIVGVQIPAAAAGGVQHWEKLMQRGTWDFALVSCAAARRADGTVRVAFGGVAAAPWRLTLSVEEDIASGGLDDDSLDALAERAMYDTSPLDGTAYKVTLAKTLLKRAMRALG